jgi:hypothetical protein
VIEIQRKYGRSLMLSGKRPGTVLRLNLIGIIAWIRQEVKEVGEALCPCTGTCFVVRRFSLETIIDEGGAGEVVIDYSAFGGARRPTPGSTLASGAILCPLS